MVHAMGKGILKYRVDSRTGCWNWIGPKLKAGYGYTRCRGIKYLSHRLCWETYNGNIPGGMHVLHRCDNPSCVNPDHLFLGTHQDNMADMYSKGRHNYGTTIGEKHHSSKLTSGDVLRIRRSCKLKCQINYFADEYGVTGAAIRKVLNRESWKHI